MQLIIDEVLNKGDYYLFIDNILASENDVAIIWGCGVCIDINYRANEAVDILRTLTACNDEIISRDASMLLYVKTLK